MFHNMIAGQPMYTGSREATVSHLTFPEVGRIGTNCNFVVVSRISFLHSIEVAAIFL